MSSIDLSALPVPDAVEELSVEAIVDEMLDSLAAKDPLLATIGPSDPAYHVLEVCAYREALVRQRANDAIRAGYLSSSWGTNLDQLAAEEGVERQSTTDETGEIAYESDDDLRSRVHDTRLAKGAGVREVYEAAALAADARVGTVLARSPSAAVVDVEWVHVLGTDPGDYTEIDDAVTDAIDAARMLADSVTVTQATANSYDVTATLHVKPGIDAETVKLAAEDAMNELALERRVSRAPIHLSAIHAALGVAGVVRVELAAPVSDLAAAVTAEYHELGTLTVTTEVASWLD